MDEQASIDDIITRIRALKLSPERQRAMLHQLVAETWPKQDLHATLKTPLITEFRKASVVACVIPVFKDETGDYKAVVGIPGDHYYDHERSKVDRLKMEYAAFGGYIDLENTPGTTLVPPQAGIAEQPQIGALRELEEELPNNLGKPVLPKIDPKRLIPVDNRTITRPNGDRLAVVGFMLKLEPHEVAAVKSHVDRMKDHHYHRAVREHTRNEISRKPEMCGPAILPVNELARETNESLLIPGQRGLFEKIASTIAREEHSPTAQRRESLLQRLEQFNRTQSGGRY